MNIAQRSPRGSWFALFAMTALLAGCSQANPQRVQGYVEGEYVNVSSPLAGALEKLFVLRGQQVKEGDPLFRLECGLETAMRDEAQQRLAQAQANLADAKKGKRPSEIESIEALLNQAQSALELSEKVLVRQEALLRTKAVSDEEVDRARTTRDQDKKRVAQLTADLATARLGARDDQIKAAEEEVKARQAALAKADWDLSQKQQAAPQAGLVFDTLYREGEWVAAGRPIVQLLPPENVKVRAFVPQAQVSRIQYGDSIKVFVDGVPEPFVGKVTFISPKAEYTPPVIYSRESREKLVFMIEARFEPPLAAKLHPGQPVDVRVGE